MQDANAGTLRMLVVDSDTESRDYYAAALRSPTGSTPVALDLFGRLDEATEAMERAQGAGTPYALAFIASPLPAGTEVTAFRAVDPYVQLVLIRPPESAPAQMETEMDGDVLCLSARPAPPVVRLVARALGAKWHAEQSLRRIRRDLDEEVAARAASIGEAAGKLREKEAFNFALFQHNPAPMTIVDREGRVVKSNLARRLSCGQLPDLGAELYAEEADAYSLNIHAALMESIRTGAVRSFPEVSHGERFETITIAPFPQGAIVITTDITERKRAQEEARRQQEQLIQAQKLAALGTLVSGVAHEVSNPNNIMILSASTLRKIVDGLLSVLDRLQQEQGDFDVGPRPYSEVRKELPELADVIARAADRIHALVTDLKDVSRQDEDGRFEPMNVNKVVRSAVSLLAGTLRKATHRFSESYAEEMPPTAGQARRIEQVVMNLLSNACQALPDKEKAIGVTTRVEPDAHFVRIEVSDEGVGIPAENLDRITDPFFTTKHNEGGTGLGLSISRKIVERHGGTLTFDSKVNQGTTAIVRLPYVPKTG